MNTPGTGTENVAARHCHAPHPVYATPLREGEAE